MSSTSGARSPARYIIDAPTTFAEGDLPSSVNPLICAVRRLVSTTLALSEYFPRRGAVVVISFPPLDATIAYSPIREERPSEGVRDPGIESLEKTLMSVPGAQLTLPSTTILEVGPAAPSLLAVVPKDVTVSGVGQPAFTEITGDAPV
jgi:hypothetical protein